MKTIVIVCACLALVVTLSRDLAGESAGEALFKRKCGICHGLDRSQSKVMSRQEWAATIRRMRQYADILTDKEAEAIAEYLFERYGHYED